MTAFKMQIPLADLIIIIIYLVGIIVIGLLSVKRIKINSSAYFLAGRSLSWLTVGAALFASNISTIHLVGLAASGYNEGLVWGNFEWMAVFTLILLGLVFAPYYFSTKISTLPEFLERRFNKASRMILALMAIFAALFIHIGMSLFAGAAVFKQFFEIDIVTSILIISIITGIYTVLGGLKAVVVTETVQAAVLIAGAILTTIFAVLALPKIGIHNLFQLKAALKPEQLSMLQTNNPSGLNWYAVFLGYPVLGIWYWCTDQTIVQRVLGAKSKKDAQLGPLFAGCLKILPVFFMVFPGVLAFALFKDKIGSEANQTLPVLISQLVPSGIRGIISAGLLAALMSTIAAALNSCATLFALDILGYFKPQMTDKVKVRWGKFSAIFVMVLAMLWSTQGGRYSSIFEAINAIASHLAPPITAVFLWGIFWRRGTKQAAITTLLTGFSLGILSFLFDLPVIGHEKLLTHRLGIPFMMQAWWMFCLCSLIFIIVSLFTPRPDEEQIRSITWESPSQVLGGGRIKNISDHRLWAGGLILVMIFLYYIFR